MKRIHSRDDVAEALESLAEQFEQILAAQSELHLRVRYIMAHFKFRRDSPILGAPGATQAISLFELYLKDRPAFLAALTEESNESVRAEEVRRGAGTDADANTAGPASALDVQGARPH